MSGMNWQRRWDPFRDLQREMGRLFETLEPFQPWLRDPAVSGRSTCTMQATITS